MPTKWLSGGALGRVIFEAGIVTTQDELSAVWSKWMATGLVEYDGGFPAAAMELRFRATADWDTALEALRALVATNVLLESE